MTFYKASTRRHCLLTRPIKYANLSVSLTTIHQSSIRTLTMTCTISNRPSGPTFLIPSTLIFHRLDVLAGFVVVPSLSLRQSLHDGLPDRLGHLIGRSTKPKWDFSLQLKSAYSLKTVDGASYPQIYTYPPFVTSKLVMSSPSSRRRSCT